MKKRIISMLLALAMVVGVVAPSVAMAAAPTTPPAATDVVIHKVKMSSIPSDVFPGTTGVDGIEYDGTQITNPEAYFGNGYEALPGVVFTYWSITEAQYNTMTATPENYDTVDEVLTYLNQQAGTNTAPTAADGTVSVTGLTGRYWFVENQALSNLPGGETLSGQAAVPFGLEFPYIKADGTYFATGEHALHVYPKNTTTDKPEVDKDIVGHEDDETNNPIDYTVGDNVPYVISTTIQPGAQYQTAKWSDRMTEGLTFNNDITVTIGGAAAAAGDYTLDWTVNGFNLSLTPQGLAKVNNQTEPITVTINYTAELNSSAVAAIPESNDVTFHYGNNPTNGNTPIPTKPSNGEITVTKTWADGTPPAGVTAEITLYNAQTGEAVGGPVTLNGPGWTHTFTGLDNDTEYKVVETWNGYTPEYSAGAGTIGVTNHKDNNPEPIKPEEPKVVTYEKLFVKTDGKGERLEGAQFVVKNEAGQFLAYKTTVQEGLDAQALATAKTNYDNAVAAYNGRAADADAAALMSTLLSTQEAYFTAFQNARTGYTWVATEAEAHVFTSNADGQIRVYGLAEGSYSLVELEAPIGFAKLTSPVGFIIGQDSVMDIPYETGGTENAQEIKNVKVTIPETGGMGTIFFILAGLAIMATAVVVMKKRNELDEEF